MSLLLMLLQDNAAFGSLLVAVVVGLVFVLHRFNGSSSLSSSSAAAAAASRNSLLINVVRNTSDISDATIPCDNQCFGDDEDINRENAECTFDFVDQEPTLMEKASKIVSDMISGRQNHQLMIHDDVAAAVAEGSTEIRLSGYTMDLPEHVKMYHDLKATEPEDTRPLGQLLLIRAIGDISLFKRLEEDKPKYAQLVERGLFDIDTWHEVLKAERMLQEEINDVMKEADEINPGWSGSIFPTAHQCWIRQKEKKELQEKKEIEDANEKERLRELIEMEREQKAAEVAANEEKRKKKSEKKVRQKLKKQAKDRANDSNESISKPKND